MPRALPATEPPLPILLAGMGVAASAFLPWPAAWLCALAAIVVLGIPHGALDGEIARAALRRTFGSLWFLVFSAPYLTLFAGVLAGWLIFPLTSLVAFLILSVWHFGTEDAPDRPLPAILFRGGLPIALPLLFHPAATLGIFAVVAQAPLRSLTTGLPIAALLWLPVAAVAAAQAALRRDWWQLGVPTALALLFWALPPLTAFAIYFVCVHAPTHTARLLASRQAPRLHSIRDAWTRALPLTGLTLLIGAALWPAYAGAAPVRLAALTIQVLSALTLPHMLLGSALGLVQARQRATRLVAASAGVAGLRGIRPAPLR